MFQGNGLYRADFRIKILKLEITFEFREKVSTVQCDSGESKMAAICSDKAEIKMSEV